MQFEDLAVIFLIFFITCIFLWRKILNSCQMYFEWMLKKKIFCGKNRIFYQFKIFSPKFSYCVAHQACRSDYAPTLRPCVQRSWIYIFLHININSYLIIFYVLLANNISVKTKKILKHYFRLIHFTKQIFLNYAKNEIATKHCKLCRGFVCGDVLSV